MEMTMEIFVALAPAIAFAVAGFFIEVVPAVFKWFKSVLQSESTTAWLIDLTHSATLLGTSVATFLGAREGSMATILVGLVWAALCATASYKLSKWLDVVKQRNAEQEFKTRHRKMAGAVRSIVRDELQKGIRDTGDFPGA